MEYQIYGPFNVIRNKKLVDKAAIAKRAFWDDVESQVPHLSSAVGCYVFCIGKKPWYVGLAEKQAFRSECFQPHKINAYNTALSKMQGKPYLFFLAKKTVGGGRFSQPGTNGHKSSQFLENLLIGMCLSNNAQLENIRGTKFLKELVVPGVINTPQGKGKSHAVQQLRSRLKL